MAMIPPGSASTAPTYRFSRQQWLLLQRFLEGDEHDPKQMFRLADDIWEVWPYASRGSSVHPGLHRVQFTGLRSFLKPLAKWYIYSQLLQDTTWHRSWKDLPFYLVRADYYCVEQGISALDDLAAPAAFDHLWEMMALTQEGTQSATQAAYRSRTHPFWAQVRVSFGILIVLPASMSPRIRRPTDFVVDEAQLIPEPVMAQLMNKLGLHRTGRAVVNRYHHVRLCILILHLCLGRRIAELLDTPRGVGPDGPLCQLPARQGKGTNLWFRCLPNKGGKNDLVYLSPAWEDVTRYCVTTILAYSDEVRHLATPEDQHRFILLSGWNKTAGGSSAHATATQANTDFAYQDGARRKRAAKLLAHQLSVSAFQRWLNGSTGQGSTIGILAQWGITHDGAPESPIYHLQTHQARHTRQTALAQDRQLSPEILQRDLHHTSRDMQLVYQHTMRIDHARLREGVHQKQLFGLGTYWLEACLGINEQATELPGWQRGYPALLDPRWRALIQHHPHFTKANRVPCGFCVLPQGPEGCTEFLHCTETTPQGCSWFCTDPHDPQMQHELQERIIHHRERQEAHEQAGRQVAAGKAMQMAERTERLRDEALRHASAHNRTDLHALLEQYQQEPEA